MSKEKQQKSEPLGELVLRTVAMPANTNANGDIFGGWLMSQMDLGAAILAKEIALGRVVTVSVNNITFFRPAMVGDVICCYARCIKTSRRSLTMAVEIWVKKVASEPLGQRFCITEGIFTFVPIDEQGKSRELPLAWQHYSIQMDTINKAHE